MIDFVLMVTKFEYGSISFLAIMKPGAFGLNPHAASYVPISKRVDYADRDGFLFANPATHVVHQGQQMSFAGVQVSMPQKSPEMAYKQIRDDELDMEMDIDMDIEYLLVTFSGLSQESITDVYLANSGDLEATIEMLNQLEVNLSYSFNIIVCNISVESLYLHFFLFSCNDLKP